MDTQLAGDDGSVHGDLVGAYWESWRLRRGNREDRLLALRADHWADEAVDDAVEVGRPSVVALLIALAEGAPTEDDARLVGAGPLESLLVAHGERMSQPEGAALLDALDAGARRRKRFRYALRSVNVGDDVPRAVRERLLRFLQSPHD